MSLKFSNFFSRFVSLRIKFLIAFLTLLLAAIPLLSYIFINQLETDKKQSLVDKAKLLNKNFATVSRKALSENSFSFLQSLAQDMATQDNHIQSLLVISEQGTILASSHPLKYPQFTKIAKINIELLKSKQQNMIQFHEKKSILQSIYHIKKSQIGAPYNINIYMTLSMKTMQQDIRRMWYYSILWTAGFIILGIIIAIFISSKMSKPIAQLASDVQQIAQGRLDFNIRPQSNDELGRLSQDIEIMRQSIQNLTTGLEDKVRERTEELHESNNKLSKAMNALWGEMQLARKIQTALLPQIPLLDNYDILTDMKPASEVGGDYYDVIETDTGLWIFMGDVSGHGVPAGLIMMMVQTAIRTAVANSPDIMPDKLLSIVNQIIRTNIQSLREDRYMTLVALKEESPGRFAFTGLHQDLLIHRAINNEIEVIETNGMWIGIENNIEDYNTISHIELNKGDCLFLFTDGLTEAINSNGMLFDQTGLIDSLKKNAHQSLSNIRANLYQSLSSFQANDDITLLFLRRK